MLENHRVLSLDGFVLVPARRHDDQELVAAVGDNGVVVFSAVVALTLSEDAARVVALHPVALPVGGLEDNHITVLYIHVLPGHGQLYPESLAGHTAASARVIAGARAARHAGGGALQGLGGHVGPAHLQSDDRTCG